MKGLRLVAILILVAAAFIGGYIVARLRAPAELSARRADKAIGYHCPMHPSYRSDRPGNCPICGMQLVSDEAPEPSVPGRKVLFYRDPQDHTYTSDKPGLSPATGNKLEPVYEGEPTAMLMGTFRISPEKQQLIGVKYGQVELTRGSRQFRALGKVSYDETRIAKVQARIDGWIDSVFVDFTGQLIKKGQPLLTIYSPEMLASEQEYLLALRSRNILNSSPIAGNSRQAETLIAAARKRLELFELSQPQISQIEATGKPLDNVTLNAPIRGYVVERNAFPKQRITPDTILYTVADLNRVWIMAELYENEAATIRLGQSAVVTASYLDGRRFVARVGYIQPQLDPMTRTKSAWKPTIPGLS